MMQDMLKMLDFIIIYSFYPIFYRIFLKFAKEISQ